LVLAAVLLGILSLWKYKSFLENGSFGLMAGAFLSISAGLLVRSMSIGRLPFATLYEFTFLFIWGILLFYLLTWTRIRSGMFTALTGLLVFVLISYGGTLPSEARPLMPALQSYWLQIHVFTAIIAYGAFALSFCFGVLYLLKGKMEPKEKAGILPSLAKLDQLNHRAVMIGFPFLSFLIISGAIWADEVWGNWWSWDPKETWALITWLVYAAFLHARKTYSLKGKQAAIIAVLGFLLVIFTLFGVSFLLPGLHSYI
jgi:cytochrome c-type biogenesis protein CcsB